MPANRIHFPFGIDARLGRLKQESDYDAYIKQLMRQVLLTAPGERINRPELGAGVQRLVFSPNSPGVASMAQTLIYQALTTWLGSLIRTDEVRATPNQERLDIMVVYTVLARHEQRFLNLEVGV